MAAFLEMGEWYCEHQRPMSMKDIRAIGTKYFGMGDEYTEFLEYLASPEGLKEFRRELRDRVRRHGISIPPEEEWLPLTELQSETRKYWQTKPRYLRITDRGDSTFIEDITVSEEAFDRENQRLKSAGLRPAKGIFLKGLIKDEGGNGHEPDLEFLATVKDLSELTQFCKQNPEKLDLVMRVLYLAGVDDRVIDYISGGLWAKKKAIIGLTVEEGVFSPAINLLATTEGDPLRKFCCRQCGECAPKELLEEGRFPDRIAWLRHHYKEKHPGIWGKVAVTPVTPEVTTEKFLINRYGKTELRNAHNAAYISKKGTLLGNLADHQEAAVATLRELNIPVPADKDTAVKLLQKETGIIRISVEEFETNIDIAATTISQEQIKTIKKLVRQYPDNRFIYDIYDTADPGALRTIASGYGFEEFLDAVKPLEVAIPKAEVGMPTVIPTKPSPPSPKEELEFVADSPEFLAYTLTELGLREPIDKAFIEAIDRAKSKVR